MSLILQLTSKGLLFLERRYKQFIGKIFIPPGCLNLIHWWKFGPFMVPKWRKYGFTLSLVWFDWFLTPLMLMCAKNESVIQKQTLGLVTDHAFIFMKSFQYQICFMCMTSVFWRTSRESIFEGQFTVVQQYLLHQFLALFILSDYLFQMQCSLLWRKE